MKRYHVVVMWHYLKSAHTDVNFLVKSTTRENAIKERNKFADWFVECGGVKVQDERKIFQRSKNRVVDLEDYIESNGYSDLPISGETDFIGFEPIKQYCMEWNSQIIVTVKVLSENQLLNFATGLGMSGIRFNEFNREEFTYEET